MEPIYFSDLHIPGVRLSTKKPLSFEVTRNEEYGWLVVEHAELTIYVHAETREELMQDLAIEIDVLWHAYAREDDQKLSPDAQRLKKLLLETFEISEPPARGCF